MYSSPGLLEVAQAAQSLESTARDHLKGLRDWNFHWLLGCTFAVGIGLLLELPEIVHDMCEICGRKSRELKYWLAPSVDRKEYPKRDWVKKWSAFGWVLIVIGVMGEGWFEAQVSKYDSALSNMTDAVVAEAQKESANAEATAKGFDAQIAESDAKAKSAEALAKNFEAQISEERKETESERLARVQIEERLAGWRLPEEAQTKIVAKLKSLPKPPFDLSVNPNETAFMETLDSVLSKAGWTRQAPKVIPSPNGLGITMLINNKAGISILRGYVRIEVPHGLVKDFGGAVSALAEGLQAEGVTIKGFDVLQDKDPTRIHITIGSRE